jgi:DNA primase
VARRPQFLHEAALESLDLADWLSEYVDLKDGGGDERRIHVCPKCLDDEYRLYVNVSLQRWICYKCDWGRGRGDVVEFMAEISGRSETEIRIELASLVAPLPAGDITALLEAIFSPEAPTDVATAEVVEVDVPGVPGFAGLSAQPVLNYALSRGLTREQVEFNQLRAAIKVPTKKKADGSIQQIMGPWLVFPVRMAQKNVAWQGRRLRDADPKYLSSEGIHDWLWPLDAQFYSVYREGMPIIIVEGVFDALGLLRYKIPALCSFGKSLSVKQLLLLEALRPSELILMWDADAWRELVRASDRLKSTFSTVSVVDTKLATKKKVDAGDALKDPQLVPWLADRIKHRMDARSPEFFQMRIDRLMA